MMGPILITAILGMVAYANLPTKYTLGNQEPTFPYLREGKVYHIDLLKDSPALTSIKAGEIFDASPVLVMAIRRVGCKFCRNEASKLSNLSDQLKQKGIRLIGIIHETTGVEDFRPYFKGDIYYDPSKHFFGPKQRWLPLWMGFLRWSTYVNAHKEKDTKGNLKGEARLLGAIYLINKGKIVYIHLEKYWGDQVEMDALQEALDQIR